MKKILWIGDGPDCPSGFGRATREIVNRLDHRCPHFGAFDVTVLGINHRGDPGTVPYPVYTAAVGGDSIGYGRLIWMCHRDKPDLIVLQNDGWHIPYYMQRLHMRMANGEFAFPDYAGIPVVAIVAVDGKNFNGAWLDGVEHAIFWTQFALDEARAGGYVGPASVIPLGVDTSMYFPTGQRDARKRRMLPDSYVDKFIVGNVNRNQSRKRLDLTVKCFAEWLQTRGVRDAWLYLHTAPTGDSSINVEQLMKYYGVQDRFILAEPPVFYGIDEDGLRDTYCSFDVCVSTTQGEGFGLPTIEAMACRVPCIVPNWAAYGDWAQSAAQMVPCRSTAIGPPYQNVIGGVVDEEAFVDVLDALYRNRELRARMAEAGFMLANEQCFRWGTIGERYRVLFDELTGAVNEHVWRDLGRAEETVQ